MTPHRQEQINKILTRLKESGTGITRLEIARLLGIPKSEYVSRLTRQLCEQGLVIGKRGVDKRRRNIFIYFLNDLKEG